MRNILLTIFFIVIALLNMPKSVDNINIFDAVLFGLISGSAIYAAHKLSRENKKAEKVLTKK